MIADFAAAQRLSSMSRRRLQREARKASPALSRLLGHISIYDEVEEYLHDSRYKEARPQNTAQPVASTVWHDGDNDKPSVEFIEDLAAEVSLIEVS